MRKIFKLIFSLYLTIMLVLAPSLANAMEATWVEDRNIFRTGTTSTYTATKVTEEGIFRGVANITPAVSDVAKRIVKTSGVLAVVTAIDLLLDGVDWVLDPANNRIQYVLPKDRKIYSTSHIMLGMRGYIDSTDFDKMTAIACHQHGGNSVFNGKKSYSANMIFLGCTDASTGYPSGTGLLFLYNDGTNFMSYEQIAQKIIDMANADVSSGDETAKYQKTMAEIYVGDVADEIATQAVKEAEWERTKVIVDNPQPCASGILGDDPYLGSQCWICDKSLHYPLTRATREARNATRGKSCKGITDANIKSQNTQLFRNLIEARMSEGRCWSPIGPNHNIAINDAENALKECEKP